MDEFNHKAEDLERGAKTIDEFLQFLYQWFAGHTYPEDRKIFEQRSLI